ncbi:MAG: peptidylprolyl isomerase [Bacteroidota bacterium]
MIKRTVFTLLLALLMLPVLAQKKDTLVLDRIVAVVGNAIILESEIALQCQQLEAEGVIITQAVRCKVLEQLLYRKLLLHQAEVDSLYVTEEQVESELDRRFRYFLSQYPSIEQFEITTGKTVEEYKEIYREQVRQLLISQMMQNKIVGSLTVSPNEVKEYFSSLHPDSVPYINAEVEIGEIVKKPAVNPELKKYAREECEKLRQRALAGEDFTTLVKLYSKDPGSNGQNPEGKTQYDGIQRGSFVPEIDQYGFSMKPGEISPVFETDYGFHVMKLLARKGDFIDFQHILITVPVDPADLQKARLRLDSIADLIRKDSITFTEAASRFSDEEESKVNGGSLYNPYTGDTKFQVDQLSQVDPTLALVIEKMQTGELSQPTLTATRDGKEAYRILYIKSRTQPHKANLDQDWLRIQSDALIAKEEKLLKAWVDKILVNTYVKIAGDYKSCDFDSDWVKLSK